MTFVGIARFAWLAACAALLLFGCREVTDSFGADELIAHNDFERLPGWIADASLNREQAHSGRYSIKVSPATEYGLGFSHALGDLCPEQPKKLKMAGWFLVPAGAGSAALVLELKRPATGQSLQWESLELAKVVRETNKWTYVEKVVSLPPTTEYTDQCRLYLWCAQAPGPVYADDLELRVAEPTGLNRQRWLELLGVGSGLLAIGSLLSFGRGRERTALGLLMAAAGLVRAAVAVADPFLHAWDERFHALVAKNLALDPWRPLLRAAPVLPYQIQDWSANHVWLHKPPLFLWQMALSLRLFGVNELAARLPAVLLGALLVVPVFGLGKRLFGRTAGFAGALLAAFGYYDIELTAGGFVADQNDASFVVYVTLSLWAYVEYVARGRDRRWVWLIGAAAGAAVLTKWLTGLLVFAGWGLTLLFVPALRRSGRAWADLSLAASLTAALALPWTVYTHWAFPRESAWEQAYNLRHIVEVIEGHGGPPYFYLEQFGEHYGHLAWLPLLIGLAGVVRQDRAKAYRTAVLTWVLVVYAFFSLVVQTKMASFVYCLGGLMYALMGGGLSLAAEYLAARLRRPVGQVYFPLLLFGALYGLHGPTLWATHTQRSPVTEARMANTAIYRKLNWLVPPDYVVLNAPWREDIEAMFYSDRNVYGGSPDEATFRRLKAGGIRFAAFDSSRTAPLPAYLRHDPDVRIIPVRLK